MKSCARKILLIAVAACLTATARKPVVLQPARPFAEAAADFYPEIQKEYTFYQRWAETATDTELDTCRKHFRQAILDAFGGYRIRRGRELAQTRWPRQYAATCKGRAGKVRTCRQTFVALPGQEYDAQTLHTTGRGLASPPSFSPDRKRMETALTKKGSGISRSRIAIQTRRTVEEMDREIGRELQKIREKLALHNLPSDVTLGQYPL